MRTRFVVFRDQFGDDPVAVIVGTPDFSKPVPVRIHSACLTGDVFGSRRCDCGDQLQLALTRLQEAGGGIILYLAQEGRGVGLANKMRTYKLQDGGLDTVDANTTLGFDDDEREYGVAVRMLQMLGCTRVVLLTNNPAKLDGLAKAGHRDHRPHAARNADQRRQPPLHDGEGGARRPSARPSDFGARRGEGERREGAAARALNSGAARGAGYGGDDVHAWLRRRRADLHATARALHWLTAALVLTMIPIGIIMANFSLGPGR